MVCMIGLMGLTIDFGHVAARKTMLQNYVDAKAVGALKEQFGAPARTISAEDYLGTLGQTVEAAGGADVGAGAWDFAPRTFTEHPPVLLPATMVPARSATVETLDVPLFFGTLFGIHTATVRAEAIAFAPKRDVVIVQDVSGSMSGTPLTNAISADQTLVQRMQSQNMPGDRVGVVSFDDAVTGTLELTPLATQAGAVTSFIGGLSTGGVTNIAAGINGGTARFSGPDRDEVERIMILVGDGANCCTDVAQMDANTVAAADAAEAQGIDIYTIYYAGSNNNTAAFLADLKRGRGYSREAPTGPELTQILTDIVTGVPMRLVQ
jgi:hypothetical protein